MRMIKILFIIGLFGFTEGESCKDLPATFTSFQEAIYRVENASFVFEDHIETSTSSWIQSASYFSCNSETGYFIFRTNNGRQYIHDKMPIGIWRQFKNASSFGSFYNSNIKGRYTMQL